MLYYLSLTLLGYIIIAFKQNIIVINNDFNMFIIHFKNILFWYIYNEKYIKHNKSELLIDF